MANFKVNIPSGFEEDEFLEYLEDMNIPLPTVEYALCILGSHRVEPPNLVIKVQMVGETWWYVFSVALPEGGYKPLLVVMEGIFERMQMCLHPEQLPSKEGNCTVLYQKYIMGQKIKWAVCLFFKEDGSSEVRTCVDGPEDINVAVNSMEKNTPMHQVFQDVQREQTSLEQVFSRPNREIFSLNGGCTLVGKWEEGSGVTWKSLIQEGGQKYVHGEELLTRSGLVTAHHGTG